MARIQTSIPTLRSVRWRLVAETVFAIRTTVPTSDWRPRRSISPLRSGITHESGTGR
jgi:hypothetical protein